MRIQRLVTVIVSRNDLILAALIVCIIFMMILPLPIWLVDALIAVNMCLSAILLMLAMYLPSPLAFSSFPSVLLVTTLFRLAISIATTASPTTGRACASFAMFASTRDKADQTVARFVLDAKVK